MLRHPFHGIVALPGNAEQLPVSLAAPAAGDACPSRRTFFGRVLATMAAGAAIVPSRAGEAAQPWSAQRWSRYRTYPGPRRGRYTTQAVGEEGGVVTTQAVGEEGGGFPPRRPRPAPPGRVTTQAVGEEGGYFPRERYTTYALGEEGAGPWQP